MITKDDLQCVAIGILLAIAFICAHVGIALIRIAS
jgi:hypothetical protein